MLAELPVALEVALKAVVVLAAFLSLPLALGQLEHKLMGHMQGRLGPMEAGPHGMLQLVADGIKFAQKEDVTPAAADRPVFRLAPAVALIPYLVALAVIPWSAAWVAADVPASLLLVLAVTSVGVIGTLMAGWGSGNKYSLLGGLRAGAQLVSYEIPLLLAAASVAMAAGTLSLTGIVQEWSWWWLLWQAPAAVVFLVATVAELQRTPFDAPIADSEIVFGPLTEYTGLRFAFFLLAEYAGIVVMSLLFTVLFLGGWRGPFGDIGVVGALWTLLKATLVGAFILWLRVAWPRVREDQLQRLAWLVLLPVALAQLAITGVGVVVLG
ncbi:NADH-quinone oxidoreductase subunit NuoH [Ornithinimicrobium pratense]|uniref:NADH-quinone oxidoreductase subunit H n=1 Tax=Ornithinimicrobium pratense TaxID=2593973 RepID=A0A5J6V5W0_9MICO|nr:NADH-quinone oxidoreductase subunit NuoH [Ornithinimicrobium pratense]QFG69370.1 NADH-quinone oxidoreductase subunit NuoH [Ornithinimicrobium pratense]